MWCDWFSAAVDKVRRQEHKLLKEQGDETLKRTRHLWLANEERPGMAA